MSIDLQTIDQLRERAQVSYTQAKEALEATDGDILEALIWLEEKGNRTGSTQEPHHDSTDDGPTYHHHRRTRSGLSDFGRRLEDGVRDLHQMRFKILKDDVILLNLPATIALILGIVSIPISLIALMAALLLRYRIILEKPEPTSKPSEEESPRHDTASQPVEDDVNVEADASEASESENKN